MLLGFGRRVMRFRRSLRGTVVGPGGRIYTMPGGGFATVVGRSESGILTHGGQTIISLEPV